MNTIQIAPTVDSTELDTNVNDATSSTLQRVPDATVVAASVNVTARGGDVEGPSALEKLKALNLQLQSELDRYVFTQVVCRVL